MNLVKCPKCKCDIESDSYFCDQCGTELYICPSCQVFGRGRRCTQCGAELIKASEFKGTPNPQPQAPQAPQAPQQPQAPQAPQQPQPQVAPQQPQVAPQQPQVAPQQPQAPQAPSGGADKTVRPGAPSSFGIQPGHLVCPLYGIRLGLAAGVIIGRRGHYPSVFGVFGDVSGQHARIDQKGAEWTVTDIGSTNGTFINGQQIPVNVPQPIHVGDKIRFSTIEFTVDP